MKNYIDEKQKDSEFYVDSYKTQIDSDGFGNYAVFGIVHNYVNEDGTEWSRFEIKTTCYGNHESSISCSVDADKFKKLASKIK